MPVKTLFVWALDKGLVNENVARVVRFVRVAERLCPQGLTESEAQSLLRVYRTSLRPVPFTGY
jgi:site-specific recombinase XerD